MKSLMPCAASAAVGWGRLGSSIQSMSFLEAGVCWIVCRAGKPADCFHVHCAQPAMSGSASKRSTYFCTSAAELWPNSPAQSGALRRRAAASYSGMRAVTSSPATIHW